MNTSCHTYKWDVSWLMSVVLPHGSYVYVAHGWMRSWIVYVYRSWMDAFVTRYSAHRTETCHTYEFVTSHGFVMSHRWVCHVTLMSLSRHLEEFVTWKGEYRKEPCLCAGYYATCTVLQYPSTKALSLCWVLPHLTTLLDSFEVDISAPSASSFRVICVFSILSISRHMKEPFHIWVAHGTGANESFRTYKWVMSHI